MFFVLADSVRFLHPLITAVYQLFTFVHYRPITSDTDGSRDVIVGEVMKSLVEALATSAKKNKEQAERV